MDILLVALVLVALIQLTIIILLLRVRLLNLRQARFVNPSFPAFDEDFVLRARTDFVRAKEEYQRAREAAYQDVPIGGKTERKWTKDITVYRRFAEAELAESLELERFRKLIEFNLAVTRGEKISKVIKEYNDWLKIQIDTNAKTVEEAIRRYEAKLRTESGQPSTTGGG